MTMTSAAGFNAKSPTIKRILQESKEMSSNPDPSLCAAPLDSNLFEWHFTMRGPPASAFEQGIYHGRIILPPSYPLRPPMFRFMNASGRFEVNREICLSISGHHEETWQPAWGIRTALCAIRAFMESEAKGQVGGLDASEQARRRLARESRAWRCAACDPARTLEEVMLECGRRWEEAAARDGARPDGGSGSAPTTDIPKELRLAYKDELEAGGREGGAREYFLLSRIQLALPESCKNQAPTTATATTMQSTAARALVRGTVRAAGRPARLNRRTLATYTDRTLEPTDFDQVSTLPNGIRVATEALPGPFAGIGVYVDAGSRYEDAELRGVSHIVDRLAFKSTARRSSDEMLEVVETLGGNIHCASSRETLMYQAATFNTAVATATGLLAETIRDPLITEEEVMQQLETAEYEIKEIWAKPELILPELVHMAAYKDNTLGNPLLCPQDRLPMITRQVVEQYRSTFYRPERIVVAFAGVEHGEALKLSEKWFGDMKASQGPKLSQVGSQATFSSSSANAVEQQTTYSSPSTSSSSSQSSSGILSKIPLIKNLSTSAARNATAASDLAFSSPSNGINLSIPAHYTGGFLSLPPIPPPANPALPRVSHIHVAFEALPISSPDIYALAVLQTLLGGGGSFSAGGPGKGMYSRLYTNVLNQYSWCESCIAFNHSYTDSGLFGITASCEPQMISQMLDVICHEFHALTVTTGFTGLKKAEVQRAKNQLKSSLLMNLESRMVELEDLGRQVQVHGRKVGVKEMCGKIDALTIDDLRRVAKQVFGGYVDNEGKGTGAPTVVLQQGEREDLQLKEFPWDEIQERIAKWKLGRR